ncbi:aminomethyltransferase [Thermaurantimonas aggregans]|uniref:Aminomethyltransferase n=1 Tax=Thermaurantimonas aggregans TaxID=2173829 RepID=A0A401XJQ9_9FLAO|nr:glycine cleavage system aminomethyltransferase GcvT [Thermaurantimonas aggregans]MCX8148634.1 glycine cleavage system aminomethyltransferase GcvT [Thermaurantimonas aggregans]GCD77211.1 aminomethyltransferase [Thermaurantimonas aggregans]
MKQTALTHIHRAMGAKMVPFAGFEMPVQYEGLIAEHHAVRQALGVFDVSHMGEFLVEGPEALDLIQSVTTNDASKLFPGKVQYSCMTNEQGGIVDDLLVYMLAENRYMLVVNASNIEKDFQWIQSKNRFDARLTDISDQTSLLAVQGPKAAEAMQSLTDVKLSDMGYYTFQYGRFAGIDHVLISATGYTGAGGFELYVPNEAAETLWKAVLEAGKPFGIKPCGLGARDTLRLEKAFCLYGNDIDDTTNPIEAGLGWITKFTKAFTASDIVKKVKEEGPKRKLVGFEMIDRGIPRHDYPILNDQGAVIGKVTSGTQSPSLNKAIGLGYVAPDSSAPGSEIYIDIRGKQLKAVVVKTPFL